MHCINAKITETKLCCLHDRGITLGITLGIGHIVKDKFFMVDEFMEKYAG